MRGNSGKNHWRWNGGLSSQSCQFCKEIFLAKPSAKRKYCSPECVYLTTRGVPNRNSQWKGDDVSYGVLHAWVMRWKGQPSKCEHCGIVDANKWYDWANISKEYRRDLNDWIRLCRPCHRIFDDSIAKGMRTKQRKRK